MSFESHSNSEADLRRYEALLEMADLMVHHRTLPELFQEVAQRLQKVVSLDFVNLSLHDPTFDTMRLHLWQGGDTPAVPAEEAGVDTASGWVFQNQQPLLCRDLRQETRFPEILGRLRERDYRSCCLLPLTTAREKLGVLSFGSSRESAYGTQDLQLMERVAALMALAVENRGTRQALQEEKERLQALLKVSAALVTHTDLGMLLPAVGEGIRGIANYDYGSLALQEGTALRMYPLASRLGQEVIGRETAVPLHEAPAGRAMLDKETKFFKGSDLAAIDSPFARRVLQAGVQSLCCIPLKSAKGVLGSLNLGSTKEQSVCANDLSLLTQIASQLAVSLENTRAYREARELKNKLKQEKLYLEDEIRSELNFEEIVGDDPEIRKVLSDVRTVAPTDATVLILGETGTGKELIARAVHRMSQRRDHSFIKMNCAAIPTGLLESELFGHEKGAFTGAVSQKIGRLELADAGTLFLDEVGDIPLELQPKLLRVLQDQEFERLGCTRTIRVNIRIIAATNRNLAKSITERQFRSDLFYRLHVFPIRMPPLRERPQDIPLLVRYFVQKLARRMGKQIDTIPSDTLNKMRDWNWPGNIRELENLVERSVILTKGSTLYVPLAELRPQPESAETDRTLQTTDREYIIRTLRETRGVLSGPQGAAARLGLPRTSLQSKMQKLGINRKDYEVGEP
ncbi:MAG TPA: sigma 54-interacting transcriptional regulator [Terriglobales bacterium]|nr:sigma 54-interacting transcriptional regulator [Terriglobales bacterium]